METILTITFGFVCAIIGYIYGQHKHKNDFDKGYNTALNDFSNNIKIEQPITPQKFLQTGRIF